MNNNSTPNLNKPITKNICKCVPSGMCCSNKLLGCPHKHYFNQNNQYTCILSSNQPITQYYNTNYYL